MGQIKLPRKKKKRANSHAHAVAPKRKKKYHRTSVLLNDGEQSVQTHLLMASAVFQGSASSGGAGAWSVFTAQNLQPRVHVSPRTMMVPVPPFQHSPMFGHCAYNGPTAHTRVSH
jgi:hypothetical protein